MSVSVGPAAMTGQYIATSDRGGFAVITHVGSGEWEVEFDFTSTPRIAYFASMDAAIEAIEQEDATR